MEIPGISEKSTSALYKFMRIIGDGDFNLRNKALIAVQVEADVKTDFQKKYENFTHEVSHFLIDQHLASQYGEKWKLTGRGKLLKEKGSWEKLIAHENGAGKNAGKWRRAFFVLAFLAAVVVAVYYLKR